MSAGVKLMGFEWRAGRRLKGGIRLEGGFRRDEGRICDAR